MVGFMDDSDRIPQKVEGIKVHRGIDRVERYLRMCDIHDVVIAKPELKKKTDYRAYKQDPAQGG